MDDAMLAGRAAAGDLDSFGQLYDRYFGRVYDFVWRILRDSDEAAEVTRDVFSRVTQGLLELSRTTSFKSALFTTAHHAAVERAERSGRIAPLPEPVYEEAFGTFDVPDPCRLENPQLVAGDHELAALVWEAAAALNPRDYALLDLHIRQGIGGSDIANIIGVSKSSANTMVSRMKAAAEDVVGTYVLARRGSNDCDKLQAALAEFEFPPYTDQVRKAVDAHVSECERCRQARMSLSAPLEIYAGFAVVAAPMALKGDIWRSIAESWSRRAPAGRLAGAAGAAGGIGILGGGDGFDGTVFAGAGASGDEGWNRQKVVWFAGGVLGLLVFALAGGALIANGFGGGGGGGGGGASSTPSTTRTAAATRTPTAAGTLTPGVAIQTPTPNLTPPTAAPTGTPTEEPTVAPATATPTRTPAAVKTHTPTPAGTATKTPTSEPSSTPTKTPKATATPP